MEQEEETPRTLIFGFDFLYFVLYRFVLFCLVLFCFVLFVFRFNCLNLPMRGCADAGGMEEVTLFKRKVSDRSTVTPREGKGKVLMTLAKR